MSRSSPFRIPGIFYSGAVALSACSLQNFDYLQSAVETGDASGGRNSAGGQGGANSGGGSSEAGEPATGGSTSPQGGSGTGTGVGGGSGGAGVAGTSASAGSGAVGQLVNPSFELGSVGWSAEPAAELGVPNDTQYSAFVQGPIGTATIHEGRRQLSFYNSTKFYQIKVYQIITGLTDGQYTFGGWFTRGSMTDTYLYATGCGGAQPAHIAIPLGDIWTSIVLTGIEVAGGRCEVGFFVNGGSTDWLNADDFKFEPVATGG